MQRIIITTGGTGGHIFPALAVIDEIKTRFPDCRILFVGGEQGPEGRLAEQAGVEFRALPVKGILGRGLRSVGAIFRLMRSLVQAFFIVRSFKPDIVLGLGGYAGFCTVLVASWLKIPTAVHEQNSIPGACNRVLGSRVDKVFLTFPDDSGSFARSESLVCGNPVRKDIVALFLEEKGFSEASRCNLLILGGSQGAKALNEAVVSCLADFKRKGIQIWHQTGELHFEQIKKIYSQQYPEAKVSAFIEDMPAAYRFADLILCRAGASTICELLVAGKPSILVPFPYAVHDHQLKNARYVENAGAAMVLVQSYLPKVSLVRIVDDMVSVPGKLKTMGRAAKSLARPHAAQDIVDGLQSLAYSGKNSE